MAQYEKRTKTFIAFNDRGQEMKIHQYTTFFEVENRDGTLKAIPGPWRLESENGGTILHKEQGVYEVLQTTEIYRSPDGP